MLWLLEQIENIQFESIVELLPHVSLKRCERLQRIQDESTKTQSVLAELLLRYVIRKEYGLIELPPLAISKQGKPFFNNSKMFFNLSHCKKAVACAVDSFPLGVDVQEFDSFCSCSSSISSTQVSAKKKYQIEYPNDLLAEVKSLFWVLTEAERSWVMAGETNTECEHRFIQLWTFKEAYGKAIGKGILYELNQADFLPCVNNKSKDGFVFQSFLREKTVLTLCAHTLLDLQVLSCDDLFSSFLS